jgi:hypothetical protein
MSYVWPFGYIGITTHIAKGFDGVQALHLNEYVSAHCQGHATDLQNAMDKVGESNSNSVSFNVHLIMGRFVATNIHLFIGQNQ